ncbi:MAG: polysaccharide pyruvyl transferase family protein [Bryobacteraceae bacterium]
MSPRFLLYGIGGTYNYGCEAIVRGTERLLHEVWPDAVVRYASSRPNDDARRLQGCNVDIIPRLPLPGLFIRKVVRRLAAHADLEWVPPLEDTRFAEDCDIVLLIGGDLYTATTDGRQYNRSLLRFGEFVHASGRPVVLWGASVGPFERLCVRERFRNHFETNISLVTCREPDTVRYMRELNCKVNSVPCADPAFALVSEQSASTSPIRKARIGINLSPLSVLQRGQSSLRASLLQQARVINHLSATLDADIVLIPHVMCDFRAGDDDLRYLESLYAALSVSTRKHTDLLTDDAGFLGRREQLRHCDLVIAARMHCAINAVSAGVPTVFLAYSRKAEGMAEYIYGTRSYLLDLSAFTEKSATHLAGQMLAGHSSIRRQLLLRLPKLRAEARSGAMAVKKVLGKTGGIGEDVFTLQNGPIDIASESISFP